MKLILIPDSTSPSIPPFIDSIFATTDTELEIAVLNIVTKVFLSFNFCIYVVLIGLIATNRLAKLAYQLDNSREALTPFYAVLLLTKPLSDIQDYRNPRNFRKPINASNM